MNQPSVPQSDLVLSYLTLRKAVGIIGVALPFALAFGKMALQSCGIERSISCYYYTVMTNVFVGSLCAIGVFLLSTRGYDRDDAIAGRLACVFAVGVALFPTTPRPDGPLKTRIIGDVHLTCAAFLFLTFAYFSIKLFTRTDPNKTPTPEKRQRNKVYRGCGYTILGCIAVMAVVEITPLGPRVEWLKPVFFLESLAIEAFGFAWLTKGEAILKDK